VSWRDTDKRMRRAAELRQAGLSLRQIADHLAVSHPTILRDLSRWEAEQIEQLLVHTPGTYEAEEGRMYHRDVPPKAPNPSDRRMQ